MVRRYLGPGGTFVETQDDGWLIVGFMLSKHPVVEVGAAPARENQ
jgi:hypothetical protein